jgi:flagellin-like hook-associated protein FlgL
MSGITLTAGVRQNLLSLQSTASLLTTTQNRLATGKKVNSAFDNPTSFFTSQSLTNRANSLSSLLDQVGQAQQTLQSANQGLTSITSLLQQALSISQQALQAAGPGTLSYGAITTNGSLLGGVGETLGKVTATSVGNTLASGASLGLADTLSIINAGATFSVTLANTDTVASIISDINGTPAGIAGAVTAGTDGTGHLQIANSASGGTLSVTDKTGGTFLSTANTAATAASTDLFQLLSGNGGFTAGDSLTVSVSGGATQNINFGTAAGQVQTLAQLNTALQSLSGLTGSSASGSAVSFGVGASTAANSLTLGSAGSTGSTEILHELGLTAGTTNGTAVSSGNSATRSTLQTNFNNLLTQIDQLAGDASYSGVNLLKGDNLTVNFNENNTSSLQIQGVTFNSAGLGLNAISGTGFQANASINNTITAINTALTTVQAQTETFGTNASTINVRQSFTTNLINTLQTGSDNLVLADQNQESANLLTLQTRQQLSISALSISNQAQQAVLKLFP